MNDNNNQLTEQCEEIAIIGMAGRFPGARNVDEFWENLRDGVESIRPFAPEELNASGVDESMLNNPSFVNAGAVMDNADAFDASFFGISAREAEIMDPQHRVFLETAWEAMENAGYEPETFKGVIGIFGGVAPNTYFQKNLVTRSELLEMVGHYPVMIGSEREYAVTRVSFKLNLKGPSLSVNTACSTSGVAIHLACQSVLSGECDMALAGGARIKVPLKAGYLYQEGSIPSPDGHCRAFDAEARGTVIGSGVGMIVVKRLSDAIRDGDAVHAVIKGAAINNDGSLKVGFTAPSIEGQATVIAEALAMAEVSPDSIGYIEAHGTGTSLGDPIEVAALTKAFREGTNRKSFCPIGSVKTNIGHLDAGAGVAGVIKTVLALKHKQIPPSLNFNKPNPQIDFDNSPFYVNNKLSEWQAGDSPRRAGISSFGLGGTNSHIVLEEAPDLESSGPSRPRQLLLFSAKTKCALDMATANLHGYLTQHPAINIADVAYTLQTGRKAFSHRRFVVCEDVRDAAKTLKSLDPQHVKTRHLQSRDPEIVFMFPGQATQYVNMGLNLYEHEPLFQEVVDQCAEILEPLMSRDLRQLLYPEDGNSEAPAELLRKTCFQQPVIFTIEYALAKLWNHWGVHPKAMIGHSIGEYVAACIAGVFSLKDALMLVATRGRMMQDLPGGAMLSIRLPAADIKSKLDGKLSLAAVNAPSLCVVSGPTEVVAVLQLELEREDVMCRRLHTPHAFHSPIMDSIVKPFAEHVRAAQLSPPGIPFISTVTGTWITPEQATDPMYWGRQLRATVRFGEGVQELWEKPERVLLEVGPRATCSTLARQQAKDISKQTVIASFVDTATDEAEWTAMLTAMGQLWLAGVPIDCEGFYQREMRHRVALPTYPFERKRFWIEPARHVSGVEALGDATEQPTQDDDLERIIFQSAEQFAPDPLSEDDYDAPHSEAEVLLATIWKRVLGIDRISVYDSFFELGGDSLLTIQVIEHIKRETGVQLRPNTFWLNTLGQIAPHLKLEPSLSEPKPAVDRIAQHPAPRTFTPLNGFSQYLTGAAPSTQHPAPSTQHPAPRTQIHPLYFGNSQRRLFGIYHPPRARVARDEGVVLCYPIAQEYMNTHWAFRRLSNLLSRAGFHVFRFDYFGTGDSAGESGEGNVVQWKADMCSAVNELRDMSGVKKVSIVGLRLGAALAAEASTEGLDAKDLVLWDPVVHGKNYLDELKAIHYNRFPLLQGQTAERNSDELLGFPFPPEMRTAIEQINLLEPPHCVAKRILLIVSQQRSEYLQLRDQLISEGMQLDYHDITGAGGSGENKGWVDTVHDALLSIKILPTITAVLARESR